MYRFDPALRGLVEQGQGRGYLDFRDIEGYLRDHLDDAESLDRILLALEENNVDLWFTNLPPDDNLENQPSEQSTQHGDSRLLTDPGALGRYWGDDDLGMYLRAMGKHRLLRRDEEIALAIAIEVTRWRYRRHLLQCQFVARSVVEILEAVASGDASFDRCIQTSDINGLHPRLRIDDHLCELVVSEKPLEAESGMGPGYALLDLSPRRLRVG